MPSESIPAATPGNAVAARWAPAILWVAVILVGTSWPGVSLGPDGLPLDKVAHFTAYAVLAALLLRAVATPLHWQSFVLVLLAVAAFGAVDEWHQSFIPRRSMSFADWVADVSGAVVGLLAVRFLPLLSPRRHPPLP